MNTELLVNSHGEVICNQTKEKFFSCDISTQVENGFYGGYWASEFLSAYDFFSMNGKTNIIHAKNMAECATCIRMYINSACFSESELEKIDNILPADILSLVESSLHIRKVECSKEQVMSIAKRVYESYFADADLEEDFKDL